MLESLEIKNYRNLKHLQIEELGRVNLITGKNNTGKSSLLEAIAVYVTEGNPNIIHELLIERGEFYKSSEKNMLQDNIRSLSSLFTNRIVDYDSNHYISIGLLDTSLSNISKIGSKALNMQLMIAKVMKNCTNKFLQDLKNRVWKQLE